MSCYYSAMVAELIEDYEGAAQIYDLGCELKFAVSCIALARLYEQGPYVMQDEAKAAEYYAKGTEIMTPEERQQFFSERIGRNKEDRSHHVEEVWRMQDEIDALRSFNLESEVDRNILQIQGSNGSNN